MTNLRRNAFVGFCFGVVMLGGAACTSQAPKQQQVHAQPEAHAVSRLQFTAQEGWIESAPSSSMRAAEFALPGTAAEAATLVVYYFGESSGGSVAANVERWVAQFEQPDGRNSEDVLQRVVRTVLDFPSHEVYLSGTYVAETFPGSGERVNKPEWRMMGAIIESDHGFYYVKLLGPEETVRRWELSFRSFMNAIR